jgi:hypothetical protein
MPELSREALFDCLRRRRHYGTSGGPTGRPIIDLTARFDRPGTIYHDDPALGPASGHPGETALIGDIVHLPEGGCTISGRIAAAAPVERIDIFNGRELVNSIVPHAPAPNSTRLRILWEGAEYRGRFRQVIWDGGASVTGNAINRVAPVNFFNPDREVTRQGPGAVTWKALTTGNIGGVDLWLDAPASGQLAITTPLVETTLDIASVRADATVFDRSGSLPRWLKVYRLPETLHLRGVDFDCAIPLRPTGDNPVFARFTLEDGTLAWTSPIYVYR